MTLLTQYFINHLWEFYQIYNFGAVGDKKELISVCPAMILNSDCPLCTLTSRSVAALHQDAPGQMTWLEDPPPWLRPAYSVLTTK